MSTFEEDQLIAGAVLGKRIGPTGWIRVNCPMCGLRSGKDDTKQALGFNTRTLGFNCFKCGATGKLRLAPEEYDLPDDVKTDDAPPEPLEPPESFYFLAGDQSQTLAVAREYLYGRGVTDAQIAQAKLGACIDGRFANRVIVPIIDRRGDWWWYVGRVWVKKAEKPYLYPSGARNGLMYNQEAVDLETDVPLLVMEGCFDALAYWPDAVAVLGKTNEIHLDMLKKAKRPVVFVPDGDEWESGEMHACALRLEGCRAGAVRLPPRVDPDEVDRKLLRRVALESLGV